MPQCAVVGCNSTHRRTKGGSIKYHRFPGDPETRNQWLIACGKSLSNCSTARICSRHFSLSSYERDVQHELLGLPTRCRLKRGAIPDQNLPLDFLKEEKQQESAIAILLAVGLVPAKKRQGIIGGLPQDLNKMQIMEDVREGCDANPPSSPGHAEQGHARNDQVIEKPEIEKVRENGVEVDNGAEDMDAKEIIVKEEKRSDDELDEKQEEDSSHSSTSETNNKRKLECDDSPIKRLKTDIQESFITRDKIFNDFIEIAECSSVEQINSFSEQILMEIKTLNELAKEKEREWNHLLHMKKIKEELLIRLQRKRQVLLISDSDLSDFQPETNGQQSLLKCNQKSNILRDIRAVNMEKLKQRPDQRSILPKPQLDFNSSLDLRQKQKPLVDVQSIIADYRQRHPEVVPRRGRRIRHSQSEEKGNILGFSGGNFSFSQKLGSDNNSDMGLFLKSLNGNQDCPRTLTADSSYGDNTSYKDILVQFAKLSQSEKNELQMHLKNTTKPPPPYPEVTVHPVTSTSSVAPTNSLLHGILTKTPVRQTNYNSTHDITINNGSKTSFSPTLARLLTAPEKASNNLVSSTPSLGGIPSSNMSISEIFCGSKARNEITITPVGTQYETTPTKTESMEEESEEQLDRLVIDEPLENPSSRNKEDNSSDNGEDVPQCQGCNQKPAQFVCAGCGNQWYCSRNCQVTAWDDHSEVCSG